MTYDFDERLKFSQGTRGARDMEIIKKAFPDCVDVRKTDIETDKRGVDYIVTLSDGAEIGIDVKARDKGVSAYQKKGMADLLLELWSVYPDERHEGKEGWTLSKKTNVDYILYTFDEQDSNKYFLIPYQLLRMALQRKVSEWRDRYGTKFAYSNSWKTEFMCVPVCYVIGAINDVMRGIIDKPA